ncbi:DUF6079 family protein [Galactobacter valiniphilus]|uniref:DUF6079 family protein n=1 Tax=Galactobacter valiniphilus TaxID=2676122 RepID=UPI003734E7A8
MTTPDLKLPLKDAITVPEHVHASDFVLQLHSGVDQATRTLDDYVVTDAIAKSFDEALALVQSAVAQKTSKGTFIHGSFGAGKSHFMAVMHLLLTNHPEARALPGLQAAVAKYDALLQTKFLAIDYHLLGKKSFEEALFSGYLQAVERSHPNAPLPVLHRSDNLLSDAKNLRAAMGDESFFAQLNEGSAASSGWGAFAATWNADSYDIASARPATDPDRQRLVRDVVAQFFKAAVTSGEWLEISQGIKAMTAHARELGYGGIVLFLDELVLWLGQHLGDTTFIQQEVSKVAKLVESEMGGEQFPLISFVARQRELKEFLGGSGVGAEQEAIGQSFQWWEERFDSLELQAADLPEIVQRRLLQPTSELGKVSLEAAVSRVKSNPAAWKHLLDDSAGSSEVDFTKVYPFSPALVDAMVALSSVMQRERTALKLMSELLAAGRDTLTVSDVIPAGDLFDQVVLGDSKPLAESMKKAFRNAEAFYLQKMRPYLLAKHSVTEEQAAVLPRNAAFRTEDRLAKTLLLASLVPGAVSLKNLTAHKLAALNFGTVASFVPGQEHLQVLSMVKAWATEFGEVSISAAADPIISIQLTGVDYDSVLDNVRNEDSTLQRRTLVRDLLLEELGVSGQGGLLATYPYTFVWRGTKRAADLIFGNVRDTHEISDDNLTATGGNWRVAIDFPFDGSAEHGPQDDVVRMYETRNHLQSDTIAWVPHYLSMQRQDEIGKLVLLEYLFKGDRFAQNSEHLPLPDREPARTQLDNQRKNLRDQLRTALAQAYGIVTGVEANLGQRVGVGDTFVTLRDGFTPQTPQATTLRAGLDDVLRQAMTFAHPDHPKLEPGDREVTRGQISTTVTLVREAVGRGGRLDSVDKNKANAARPVLSALGLATLRENVLVAKKEEFTRWNTFTQWAAAGGQVTVGSLRERLAPLGLTSELQDALILTWAALDDRQWKRHSAITPVPGVGEVKNDMVLEPAVLPERDVWDAAIDAAEKVFGIPREHVLNAAAVTRLGQAVLRAAGPMRAPATNLVSVLEQHDEALGLDASATTGRLHTARRGRDLIEALHTNTEPAKAVTTLGTFDLSSEPQPLAKSLKSADDIQAAVHGADWQLLDKISQVDTGGDIADALHTAARAEELHRPLAAALTQARTAVLVRLTATSAPAVPGTEPQPVPVDDPKPKPGPGPVDDPDLVELTIDGEDVLESQIVALREAFATKQPGKKLHVKWWLA